MSIFDWLSGKRPDSGVFSGGPGDTAETAIVINLVNYQAGVAAEYVYVERACGQRGVDWTLDHQRLLSQDGKMYDVLEVILQDESRRTFWFDITAFYGKF